MTARLVSIEPSRDFTDRREIKVWLSDHGRITSVTFTGPTNGMGVVHADLGPEWDLIRVDNPGRFNDHFDHTWILRFYGSNL